MCDEDGAGLAAGMQARGPDVILYAASKRFPLREGRLLHTRNQIQREGPEKEGRCSNKVCGIPLVLLGRSPLLSKTTGELL